MFCHQADGMVTRFTVERRGLAARVTVALADAGPRPAFTVEVETDPGVGHAPPPRDGDWSELRIGPDSAWFLVEYRDARPTSRPSLVLDATRDWRVTWDVLAPHPVLVEYRRRKLERSRR